MKKNAQGDDLSIEDIISKLPEIELANLDRISEVLDKAVDDLGEWEEMDETLEYNLAE